MNKTLYFTLAKNNIKRNQTTFFPFALSSATMIALFYMISAITAQVIKTEHNFYGIATMKIILHFGVIVCGIFASGVIFYTNRFLIKQRSKELGLYSILGMEKRHIAKVLFFETGIIGICCLIAGLFFGILFSKLMFLLLLKMMKLNSTIPFGISIAVILRTIFIFGALFCANILQNILKLKFMKTIDLLHDGAMGEREPKANWIFAALSIVCLSAGYYIALTTKNPIRAINSFFIAVLLVMAGTHLLFMSGSVAILKLLRKNKSFYYHKTHFITVSGMIHRMKRNAAGLANICILSTAVLVVISSTISLYAGVQDTLANSYPRDVITTYYCPTIAELTYEEQTSGIQPEPAANPKDIQAAVLRHAKQYNVTVSNFYHKYDMFLIGLETEENVFNEERHNLEDEHSVFINAASLEEYNQSVKEEERLESLENGYVWVIDNTGKIADGDKFSVCGIELKAKSLPQKQLGSEGLNMLFPQDFSAIEAEYRNIQILLPTRQDIDALADAANFAKKDSGFDSSVSVTYSYLFDTDGKQKDIENFCSTLRNALNDADIPHVAIVRDIFEAKDQINSMYASIFFIGIFIAVMFLLATVLIIYYKQITEGYEDQNRFTILKKVGMGQKEVKRVITSQILQVFFLPLLLSAVHIAFSFPIVKKLLAIMGLINVNLFTLCTIGSILVFGIVYGAVYYLTAKSYYKLVYTRKNRGV